MRDVRMLLGDLDPAAGSVDVSTEEQRRRDLHRILATSRVKSPAASGRGPRRLVLAGGMAAVLVAAGVTVGVVGLGSQPSAAYAATPRMLDYRAPAVPMDASQRLRELAAVASAAAAPTRPAGSVEHLRSANWWLHSAISGGGAISAVFPEEWESWRTDDHGGRLVKHGLPPQFESASDERAWQREVGEAGLETSTVERAAGEFYSMWGDAVPTDPAALRKWLVPGGVTGGDADVAARYIEAVAELAGVRLLGPAARDAILQLLADLPATVFFGTVVDRAGRSGEAFGVDSAFHGLPTRYMLIVDSRDGSLLGYEEMLTTSAGALNVKVPAVIAYRSYLAADFSSMPSR